MVCVIFNKFQKKIDHAVNEAAVLVLENLYCQWCILNVNKIEIVNSSVSPCSAHAEWQFKAYSTRLSIYDTICI